MTGPANESTAEKDRGLGESNALALDTRNATGSEEVPVLELKDFLSQC